MKELIFEDVKGKSMVEVVQRYWPEATDQQANFIIWEMTCFPMNTEIALKQLYDLYRSGFHPNLTPE
jgi:hypothetical protein